jgi:hypothetical protein
VFAHVVSIGEPALHAKNDVLVNWNRNAWVTFAAKVNTGES